MGIPLIDTLEPLGNFFAVKAKHVGVGDVSLESVLNSSSIELTKKINATDVEAIYAKKSEIPTIPTKISVFTNDAGYATKEYVDKHAGTGTVTSVKVGNISYNPESGVVNLPAYPTSLPASDVSNWAKASSKPAYTKAEVGLGNVDNTRDADKPISEATQMALNSKINYSDVSYVTPDMYAGATDDEKFSAMFADPNAKNIVINKTYTLEQHHVSEYCEKMSGTGEIVNHTRSSEVNNLIDLTAIRCIEGIKFNSDYASLGSLYINGIRGKVEIINCEFKGYNVNIKSPDYTEGSQILCKNTDELFVRNCVFVDNGYTAGTESANLNRCITMSGEGKSCLVSECNFNNVNQAIVTGSQIKNVIINDNYFYKVTDNVLYHLSDGIAIFRNNKCEDCTDECVVAINAVLDSNVIVNQHNYVFSLNGNNSNLIMMKDNVITKNDKQSSCNVLRFRNAAYTCKNLQIVNNNIFSENETNPYCLNNINVDNLLIKDNNINLMINSSGKIISGTCKNATVIGNIINDGINTTDNIQFFDTPTVGNLVYEDNILSSNIRPFNNMTKLKSSRIRKVVNKSWYSNDNLPNIIYGQEEPENLSTQMGTNIGTIYINLANTTGEGFMFVWINNTWVTIK